MHSWKRENLNLTNSRDIVDSVYRMSKTLAHRKRWASTTKKSKQKYLKFRISSKEFRTAEVELAKPALRNSIFLVRHSAVHKRFY
jgi:hypothetical protein